MAEIVKKKYRDIVIPPLSYYRPGIYYGYYGVTSTEQIEETRDHTNLLWVIPWNSSEQQHNLALGYIKKGNKPTFLDVGATIFVAETSDTVKLDSGSEDRLTKWFQRLRENDCLRQIIGLVMYDEFNLFGGFTNTKIIDSLTLIKKCADKFHELSNVKYVATYAVGADFKCLEYFDIVGFDIYERHSGIFRRGEIYESRLRANLKSHQRTLIYPGGYIGQDPNPFVNFAFRNREVFGVIPFIWDVNNSTSQGMFDDIKHNGMADVYRRAGKYVISGV